MSSSGSRARSLKRAMPVGPLRDWSFDFQHLHMKSGALSPPKRFAFELRDIVRRQALPGYTLTIAHALGRERLNFVAIRPDPFDAAMRSLGLRSTNHHPVDMS